MAELLNRGDKNPGYIIDYVSAGSTSGLQSGILALLAVSITANSQNYLHLQVCVLLAVRLGLVRDSC